MEKEKYYLILGNITFNHFVDEELALFKKPEAEQKALVHDMHSVLVFDTEKGASNYGEESLCNGCESYVVINSFKGEIVFEKKSDEEFIVNKILE